MRGEGVSEGVTAKPVLDIICYFIVSLHMPCKLRHNTYSHLPSTPYVPLQWLEPVVSCQSLGGHAAKNPGGASPPNA